MSVSSSAIVGPALTKRPNIQAQLLDFFVPLMGGVLLGLAFYSDDFSQFAWFALLPTAWALTRKTGTVALYCGCFYGGLVSSLLSLDWLRRSYAGQLVDSWIIIGHLLAFYWTVAIAVGRRFARIVHLPMFILLPVYIVAVEEVRWHVAGFIVNDGFPLLQLGLTQAEHLHVVQVADLGGIAALTGIIAACNGALYDVARRQFLPALCGAILLLVSLSYGHWRLAQAIDETGPTVGLVSGRLDVATCGQLTRAMADLKDAHETTSIGRRTVPYPALLVWKETAAAPLITGPSYTFANESRRSQPQRDSGHLIEQLIDVGTTIDCSLVVGVVRRDYLNDRAYKVNSVLYVRHSAPSVTYYDKIHLAPWTEFRPYLADALGVLPYTKRRTKSMPFSRGSTQRVFRLDDPSRDYSFSPTICYDLLFPSDHRRLMRTGEAGFVPEFFVSSADEMGSRRTSFSRMTTKYQRFRAIESRRAYVRNAEYGVSMFVDGCGRAIETNIVQLPNNQTISLAQVPIDTRISPYVYCGEWVSVLACGFVAISFVLRRPVKKPPQGSE